MQNFIDGNREMFDIEKHDYAEYDYRSLANYVVVTIETDGICPGLYSMIGLAAVSVRDKNRVFYKNIAPITDKYNESTLERLGLTREMTLSFEKAEDVIPTFCKWVSNLYVDKPILVSDNPAFSFHFLTYYSMLYNNGYFPFTFIPRGISDIYSGLTNSVTLSGEWKRWTKYKPDLTCLSEAIRITEAFRVMIKKYQMVEKKPNLIVPKHMSSSINKKYNFGYKKRDDFSKKEPSVTLSNDYLHSSEFDYDSRTNFESDTLNLTSLNSDDLNKKYD